MPPSIIQPNTCATCPFKFRDDRGSLFCRRNPPVSHILWGKDQSGHPVVAGEAGAFPQVQEVWFCWEHPGLKRQLASAAPMSDLAGNHNTDFSSLNRGAARA